MSRTIVLFGPNAEEVSASLRSRHPLVDWRTEADPEAAMRHLPYAHAIIANGPSVNDRLLSCATQLEWIQALTTGVDTILGSNFLPRDAAVCSTRGIHGPQMSELVFLYMLALSRNFVGMMQNQALRLWEAWPQPMLEGKTVTIVGVGSIAEALAPRCKAFGMTVYGVTGTPRNLPCFDRLFERAALKQATSLADFLVLLVPYTAETDRMIDADTLGAMKPTAYLINVARGGIVDESALIDALQSRQIAGAGLDVFSAEPLPEANRLWRLDNVILTPRVGGLSDIYIQQILPIVEHNVAAYLAGRPADFLNRVR